MARIEEHPWPARIMHYIHLISMVLLALSGFYIHYPFYEGGMNLMRMIHFIAMYVVLVNLVVRIYWAFFGQSRDWRTFVYEKSNRGQFLPIIKYYLFLQKEHPVTGKYNTLQKSTYNFWFVLLVLQAITGFAMYWPTAPFFETLNAAVGTVQTMRLIHFLVMWVFIVTTAIHVYLSLAEEISQFFLMFFGVETKND